MLFGLRTVHIRMYMYSSNFMQNRTFHGLILQFEAFLNSYIYYCLPHKVKILRIWSNRENRIPAIWYIVSYVYTYMHDILYISLYILYNHG